jgi:hypothetical protein
MAPTLFLYVIKICLLDTIWKSPSSDDINYSRCKLYLYYPITCTHRNIYKEPMYWFNFTSPDVFHNYHKIYTFIQHIYNFLQSIHRLHVSALLDHHQALYMTRFLWF